MENETRVTQNELQENSRDNSSNSNEDTAIKRSRKGPAAGGMPSEVAVMIMNKLSLPNVADVLKVFKTWAHALPSYVPERPQAPWLWMSGAQRHCRPRYLTGVVDGSTVRADLLPADRGMRCLSTGDGMMLASCPGGRLFLLNPLFPEHNVLTLPSLPWEPNHVSRVVLSARRPGACMALAVHWEEVHLWVEWRGAQWEALAGFFPKRLTHAVVFMEVFIALDMDSAIWAINPHSNDTKVSRLPLPWYNPVVDKCNRKGYLVECGGEILFVWPDEQYATMRLIEVFSLDVSRGSWARRFGLGEAAVFLSNKGSVALEKAAEAGCMENSVYYVPYPRGATWRIYSMEDGSVMTSPRRRLCPANTGDRAWIIPRLPWPAP